MNGIQEVSGSIPLISTNKPQGQKPCGFVIPRLGRIRNPVGNRLAYSVTAFQGKSDGKTTDMSVLTEVRDLEAVIAYVRSLPYTSENLLLMGCSQGGFVSALTAAKHPDLVNQLVLCYAMDVVDMDPFEKIKSYSGPVLIVHGTEDRIVHPDYAQRAQKCYPDAQLHLIESGAHGFSKKHDAIAMGYLKEFLFQG